MKKMNEINDVTKMDAYVIFFLGFVMSPIELIVKAFVGMKLWNWLLVPTATAYNYTIPVLTIGYALCLLLVSSFFTKNRYVDITQSKIGKDKIYFEVLIGSWAFSLFSLFIGFIVKTLLF